MEYRHMDLVDSYASRHQMLSENKNESEILASGKYNEQFKINCQ